MVNQSRDKMTMSVKKKLTDNPPILLTFHDAVDESNNSSLMPKRAIIIEN